MRFTPEFHSESHERTGFCCFVSECSAGVIHVVISIASLHEDIAREIDAEGAGGQPGNLRTRSESADITLQSKEEPAGKVDLASQADDRIHPPLARKFGGGKGVIQSRNHLSLIDGGRPPFALRSASGICPKAIPTPLR